MAPPFDFLERCFLPLLARLSNATIRKGLKPTTYAVMGTFKGQPLDTVAWMTVR